MKIKFNFPEQGETADNSKDLPPELCKLIPLRREDRAVYIVQSEDNKFSAMEPNDNLNGTYTRVCLLNASTNEILGTCKVIRKLAWDYTVVRV